MKFRNILGLATLVVAMLPEVASAAVPQTPFEASSSSGANWTTLSQEQAYLTNLDLAYPQITVSRIGTSQQGRPINAIVINGGGTSAAFCAVHAGTEPAGREACLTYARTAVAHGVATTLVPTPNPDGFQLKSRFLANGVNLNADLIRLSSPEARALVNGVVVARGVTQLMDLHETERSGPPVEFPDIRPMNWSNPVLRDQSVALVNKVRVAEQSAGWATGWYTINPGQVNGSSWQMCSVHNCAVAPVETRGNGKQARKTRWRQHLIALQAVLG